MKALFLQLRYSIAGAIVLAAAGLGIAASVVGDQRRAAAELAQARTINAQAQAQLDGVYTERQEIAEFLPRFAALSRLGAFGDERRLEWIERLEAVRDELKLPRLVYTLSPRSAYPELPDPVPGLRFEASRLKVEFGLVHEGDLFALLGRLRVPAMGFPEVQSCTIRRAATIGPPPAGETRGMPADGNLQGDCQVDWITLIAAKPADAPAPAGSPNPSKAGP